MPGVHVKVLGSKPPSTREQNRKWASWGGSLRADFMSESLAATAQRVTPRGRHRSCHCWQGALLTSEGSLLPRALLPFQKERRKEPRVLEPTSGEGAAALIRKLDLFVHRNAERKKQNPPHCFISPPSSSTFYCAMKRLFTLRKMNVYLRCDGTRAPVGARPRGGLAGVLPGPPRAPQGSACGATACPSRGACTGSR